MDRSRVDRTLEDWKSVANAARRPATAPRPVVVRTGLSSAPIAGAALLVVALVIAVGWLGRHEPNGGIGSSQSPLPVPTTSATTPSAAPTEGSCDPAALSARITMWEGAAGHRIATVELTNVGPEPCDVPTMARPMLIDGGGTVLIEGSNPTTSGSVKLAAGGVLTTLVQTGNYCGPDPVAPVVIAFVFGDGSRIVAIPFSPSDTTLPPCNGAPGSAGTIDMHPWAP